MPGSVVWDEYLWKAHFQPLEELVARAREDRTLVWRAIRETFKNDLGYQSQPVGQFRGTHAVLKEFEEYFLSIGEWGEAVKMWRRSVQRRRSMSYVPRAGCANLEYEETYYPNQRAILASYDELIRLVRLYDPQSKELARYEGERAMVAELKQIPSRYSKDKRKIDDEVFWQLISEGWQSGAESTDEAVTDLVDRLEVLSSREIVKFHKILQKRLGELHHWDLWGVAYLLNGGCGDDSFEYFKGWVVAQGRKSFERAAVAPEEWGVEICERCADEELESEGLLLAAEEALDRQGWEGELPTTKEKLPSGKEWKEGELGNRYPRLHARLRSLAKTEAK